MISISMEEEGEGATSKPRGIRSKNVFSFQRKKERKIVRRQSQILITELFLNSCWRFTLCASVVFLKETSARVTVFKSVSEPITLTGAIAKGNFAKTEKK